MIRYALRRTTFDHIGIAFTLSVIASLYSFVATDLMRTAPAELLLVDMDVHTRAANAPPVEVASGAPPPVARFVAGRDPVADLFARIGYKLDSVRAHGQVPRIFMANLPPDLSDISVPEQRKVIFIKTALPLILHVNELIALDRERIVALRDDVAAGISLSPADQGWLARKAEEYGLDKLDFAELVRRVDVVPPSLALAQSAEESGWGTSRFAREGNALFGQRTWRDDAGAGIVPHRRGDGERFRVAAFDHLIDGVKSYARNLNSHPVYDKFRRLRAVLRRDGDGISGYALAGALTRYSERGLAYVQSIRTIIRVNALDVFDGASLGDRVVTDTEAYGVPDA